MCVRNVAGTKANHLSQLNMPEHQHLPDLLSIYALGALTPEEATRLEAHLGGCADCAEELGIYLATAAALDGHQDLPQHIWDGIERRTGDSKRGVVVDLSRRRPGGFTKAILSVAASVSLVIAGAAIATLAEDDAIGRSDVVAAADEAANQPGTLVAEFEVETAVVARIILTEEGQGYIIPTHELPELDPSRTYQLWVVNPDDAVISAGVLGSKPTPSVFTWTGEVSALALTREVAGGVTSSDGDVVSVATDF